MPAVMLPTPSWDERILRADAGTVDRLFVTTRASRPTRAEQGLARDLVGMGMDKRLSAYGPCRMG
ncbi:MAG TPA: hypothetical protein VF216_07470 [Mizugakiibacter sp.]